MNTLNLIKLTQEQKIKGVWLSEIKGEGEYRQWDANGQLCIKANYKNNEKCGKYLRWHTNGQFFIKCFYKKGKLYNEYLEWYDNGKLNVKAFYENGKTISCEYFRST